MGSRHGGWWSNYKFATQSWPRGSSDCMETKVVVDNTRKHNAGVHCGLLIQGCVCLAGSFNSFIVLRVELTIFPGTFNTWVKFPKICSDSCWRVCMCVWGAGGVKDLTRSWRSCLSCFNFFGNVFWVVPYICQLFSHWATELLPRHVYLRAAPVHLLLAGSSFLHFPKWSTLKWGEGCECIPTIGVIQRTASPLGSFRGPGARVPR